MMSNTILYKKYKLLLSVVVLSLWACNLEKEIELPLPHYDTQPVVECYLEPGKPFRLLLTRSSYYYDPFFTDDIFETLGNLLLNEAEVTISYGGKEVRLDNNFQIDAETSKFYNYNSDETVPQDPGIVYILHIRLPDGTTISSSAEMLPVVPIDSVVVEKNDQGKYRILTYITDDPDTENYYKRMLNRGPGLDSLHQSFVVDDAIFSGQVLFGTSFSYDEGAVVVNTIIHISKEYYRFVNSVDNAVLAGGSPFAQPGRIESNVYGDADPMGIFTVTPFDRIETVVGR